MRWLSAIDSPPPPGKYQIYSSHGIEVGLFYGNGVWVTIGGDPVAPTLWSPMLIEPPASA